jgi:hypothetical protein
MAHPSQQALVQSSIPVRASVFEAYIGAVFSESGIDLVGQWVKPLIRRVLDLDDYAQRTPRIELSPLSRRGDSDAGTDDMNERFLYGIDALSIAETTSTAVGAGTGGYGPAMNQFSTRSIAPSSHDGSISTPLTTSSTFLDAAYDQPIPVATGRSSQGRPSPLRHEIRDYQPGRYSPNFPGHHSPAQLSFAPSSQYTQATVPSIPSYSHQQSGKSPPLPDANGSFRSSSSSTVRPPATSPRDSHSTGATSASSQLSPSVTSPSSSDSTGSGQSLASTRSVAGGHLALFNQMATQKKERVEWKISSSGPPHKPKFDAQVFGKCQSFDLRMY